MVEDYKNPTFKKLLQKLQEESWQLELIISGFAIFGLFAAFGELKIGLKTAQYEEQVYGGIFFTVALVSCVILLFNLLLHVVLRGLWIGALGLRYVSGDIDYDVLRYSPKFTRYLSKKIGSFDKYIATLENYCSIIFAISFLLVFYVLAMTLCLVSIALVAIYIIDNDNLPENWRLAIGIPLLLFILSGMFLTFIDFVTQGWLKRKKWISRLYFPIYWVFSFLTLSFLYRPLVYNFLDNKFGKRISFFLLPIFVALIIATSIVDQKSNYFNDALGFSSSSYYGHPQDYEDQLIEKDELTETASIQSKVITDPFIKVFINFDNNIEDDIFRFEPDLKPAKDQRGLNAMIFVQDVNWSKIGQKRRLYLKTFNDIYGIRIDTLNVKSDFIVGHNIKKQLGFETYISTEKLSQGKHMLNITRKRIRKGDTTNVFLRTIPFWYYKD
jgi:hypothetical protein